jgi:ATP-dependent RNA helicase DeaD
MKTFQEMGIPESLIHTLQSIQFNTPTPIQEKAIPLALQGKDILGSAQTGTGKTGAFSIPLIVKILSNSISCALVITPTRELATQVFKQLQTMISKKSKIKSALLIGGDSIMKQITQLNNKPRIIVGTPGRINDHLRRDDSILRNTDFLVLDETDRMLDMGFSIQIENIIKYVADKRQTLLFSATLPKNIVHIAQKYLNEPVRVATSTVSSPAANIKQDILQIKEEDKYHELASQLNKREGSIIVFVKTKHGTEKIADKLLKDGHNVSAIHGDLRQNKRDRVITGFRNKKYRILVATDVAARGLDIPHIEHVINYDLPQSPEDYIHRIGRTARAGLHGSALSIISPSDKGKWYAIEKLLNPNADDRSPKKHLDKKKRFNNNNKHKNRKRAGTRKAA